MAYSNRDGDKESFWRWVTGLQAESGLTAREFCKREGLNVSTFYSWRHTLRQRDQAVLRRQAKDDGEESVKDGSGGRAKKARKTKRPAKSADKSANAATLVPLEVIADMEPPLEIVHPRGHVVRVPSVFSKDSLRQLLAVLDGDKASGH